ncbi:hypothetical protein JF73_17000 (plasmid) [Lactobacillus helsingborgensis]|uniref:Replication initiation protein n=2 Tax=Lactobacillus TaxID=1578 RepID=A0AA47GHN9_9LACO|nr:MULTISPECIES: replication initiation protein [Lactobacillus]KJY54686.1 hypothetical protein JF74_18570 [Lactobacillus melliventris]KJY60618.1 hypothetical protein JF73_17000 [Lactobacillus helsingborgensis]UZX30575.1 replication initiation protein [Lactobacillus helsingborgensis]UZX32386.1 replication initiation protein [Lactobacillus helsingborgensis]
MSKSKDEKKVENIELLSEKDLVTNAKDPIVEKKQLSNMVKFGNRVNEVDLFGVVDTFTEFENNLFYACISQIYGESGNIIKFSSRKVKTLIGYRQNTSMKQLVNKITKAFNKFTKITETIEKEDAKTGRRYKEVGSIFDKCIVFEDDLECYVQIKEEFRHLFNDVDSWTRFSLSQYVRLKARYSKALFRQLKQFRTTGIRKFTYENFRQIMKIPETYQTNNIKQRVLIPCMEELSPYFQNLNLTVIYRKGQRGRKTAAYQFTWRPEARLSKDFRKNTVLEESVAIYNIRTNPWLNVKQKCDAIDRYRELKLGTTYKKYRSAHRGTYFLDNFKDLRKKTRPILISSHLDSVWNYSSNKVLDVINFYSKLLKEGALTEGDIDDFVALEELYLRKRQKELEKAKQQRLKPSVSEPAKDTVLSAVIDFTTPNNRDFDEDRVHKVLKEDAVNVFAENKRGQDNRNEEIKSLFDD